MDATVCNMFDVGYQLCCMLQGAKKLTSSLCCKQHRRL